MKLTDLTVRPPVKLFYGWYVLAACCAVLFYLAGLFWWGFSVFIPPILDEFGWSRSQISLALTLQGLEGIGAAPIVGLLVDKIGTRRLMLFGLTTAALGIVLVSMAQNLMQFYGAFLVLSFGTSAGTGLVTQSLVVRWFSRRRGTAITALMVSPAMGAMVLIPVLTVAIEALGWRQTMLIGGIGLWIIAVPILLVARNSPESMGLRPDGDGPEPAPSTAEGGAPTPAQEHGFTVREVLRLPTFWYLAGAYTLWNLGTQGVQPHLFVALKGIGMSQASAATVSALLPGISIGGRVIFGFLSDHVDKRLLLFIVGALQALGVALLAAFILNPDQLWLVYTFLVPFSLGFGGSIPLRIVTGGQYFGRKNFPAVFGVLQAVTQSGGMLGPLMAGWIYDTTGSYFVAFAMSSVLILATLPLVVFAKNPQPKMAKAGAGS